MAAREAVRSIVWLDQGQVELVRRVADLAGLEVVGAGSDSRGQSQAIAAEFACTALDDLRSAVARAATETPEIRLIFIASHVNFGAAPEDIRALSAAAARGVKIASLEPIPGAALDLGLLRQPESEVVHSPAWVVPLMRLGKPMREAAELLHSFGEARTAAFEGWCGPNEGSLGAALYNGMDLMLSLMGEPEAVDAVFVSASRGMGVHPLPAETLSGLDGDLTANLRYADGRGAAVVLSSRASRWNRTLTLLGGGGRMRIFDDGFEWLAPDGGKIDELRFKKSTRGGVALAHAPASIADGVRRIVDGAPDAPSDAAAVLAISQAALLSAQTGQPESPATIRRMAGLG